MVPMMAGLKSINRIPTTKSGLRTSHMNQADIDKMESRRVEFVSYVKTNGSATIEELENHLNCCQKNVRNDAEALRDTGKIRITRKGTGLVVFRMPFES